MKMRDRRLFELGARGWGLVIGVLVIGILVYWLLVIGNWLLGSP